MILPVQMLSTMMMCILESYTLEEFIYHPLTSAQTSETNPPTFTFQIEITQMYYFNLQWIALCNQFGLLNVQKHHHTVCIRWEAYINMYVHRKNKTTKCGKLVQETKCSFFSIRLANSLRLAFTVNYFRADSALCDLYPYIPTSSLLS